MKHILLTFAAVFALAGCASVPGSDAAMAAGASVVDALTGPDTDYKNYLAHCRAEVKAKADAAKERSVALQTALSSGNEKTQYGATLIMAFEAGQGGPKIACTAERKKGAMEMLMHDNALLDLGKDLYFDNRAEKRFNRQLDFDERALKITTDAARDARRDDNKFVTDLVGTQASRDSAAAAAEAARRQSATPPPAE